MQSLSPLTLFVAKPADVPYGEAMNRIRMWLDHQKMQLAHFKLAPMGRVGFEIGFHSDHDATQFESGFEWLPLA
jgi:hypothetical protein